MLNRFTSTGTSENYVLPKRRQIRGKRKLNDKVQYSSSDITSSAIVPEGSPSRVMGWSLVLIVINAVIGGYLREMRWSITFCETQTKQSDISSFFFYIIIIYTNDQLVNNVRVKWLALLPKMSLNSKCTYCRT